MSNEQEEFRFINGTPVRYFVMCLNEALTGYTVIPRPHYTMQSARMHRDSVAKMYHPFIVQEVE